MKLNDKMQDMIPDTSPTLLVCTVVALLIVLKFVELKMQAAWNWVGRLLERPPEPVGGPPPPVAHQPLPQFSARVCRGNRRIRGDV